MLRSNEYVHINMKCFSYCDIHHNTYVLENNQYCDNDLSRTVQPQLCCYSGLNVGS